MYGLDSPLVYISEIEASANYAYYVNAHYINEDSIVQIYKRTEKGNTNASCDFRAS